VQVAIPPISEYSTLFVRFERRTPSKTAGIEFTNGDQPGVRLRKGDEGHAAARKG
jgi:hypothetical protein